MRDQLMAKYTTDPATEGYGIYLVLWFADPDKPISQSPDGVRPSSPDELRQWLERDLSPEKARKIPMTLERRLISLWTCSMGLVEAILR